jgi:predicted TIM-barrel fold metal-dependent hydrolase
MFDHRWTNQTIAPLIDTCLDQFGPERCMFGSNFPVDSLYSDYATLAAAHRQIVPETCHVNVFGGTAATFYNL